MTPEGSVKLVKLLQPEKVAPPIQVTPEGSVKLVKPLQPEKAYLPIEVTPEESVRLVKPLHYMYLLLVDYQYYTF